MTYFVPPQFPLLLVVPAAACDWVRRRWGMGSAWKVAGLSGIAFVATLIAVQYPFANFLMSDGAKNWFFGSMHFGYYIPPDSYLRRGVFRVMEQTGTQFAVVLGQAVLAAALMTRLGMGIGNWIRGVQR